MNKLLPILLVVVLSGCSFFSSEYTCTSNKYATVYLAISDKEMLLETPTSTYVYDIVKQSESKVRGILDNSSKHVLVFHKEYQSFQSPQSYTSV